MIEKKGMQKHGEGLRKSVGRSECDSGEMMHTENGRKEPERHNAGHDMNDAMRNTALVLRRLLHPHDRTLACGGGEGRSCRRKRWLHVCARAFTTDLLL
jgi:hypothetical protein